MSQIALSIDVEDWYHGLHITSKGKDPVSERLGIKKQYDRNYHLLEAPINRLLDLFELANIKATFFIVADLIGQYRKVFELIINAGHEIACHDLYHIMYCGQGDTSEKHLFTENTRIAKEKLEDFSGKEIVGYRAPFGYFRRWMIEPLIELGFQYDSSVASNSMYSKIEKSYRAFKSHPAMITGYSGGQLLEIPWPYLSVMGFRIPTGGGPALRIFHYKVTQMGLAQSLKRGDTSLYLHPLDIGEIPLPQIIVSAFSKFFWRNRGETTYRRLERLLKRYENQYCSCKDILDKYQSTIEITAGLRKA